MKDYIVIGSANKAEEHQAKPSTLLRQYDDPGNAYEYLGVLAKRVEIEWAEIVNTFSGDVHFRLDQKREQMRLGGML